MGKKRPKRKKPSARKAKRQITLTDKVWQDYPNAPIGWAVLDNTGEVHFWWFRRLAEEFAADQDERLDDGSKRNIYPLWAGQPVPHAE